MKKLTCENGDKFGYWEIIDSTPITKIGHTYVLAKCSCGKEQLICLSDLKHTRTTGCRNCKARERSRDIKIGDIYKHWTVIEGPKISSYNCVLWKAQCSCKKHSRWIQGNELTDKNKCFKCQQCSGKERGLKQSATNGRVGDLNATKYGKLRRVAEQRNLPFKVTIKYLWNLFVSQK